MHVRDSNSPEADMFRQNPKTVRHREKTRATSERLSDVNFRLFIFILL